MSFSKALLVATGIIFGLSTIANAAPRSHSNNSGYGYNDNSTIPGKAQQDNFKNTY